MKCLDFFEDSAYTRSNVEVAVPCTNEDGLPKGGEGANSEIQNADAYIWALDKSRLDLSRDWDYEAFVSEHLDSYLERTVKPCRIEIERTILKS